MTRFFSLAVVIALAGCDAGTPSASGGRVDDILALTADATAGQAAYTQLCETCHQADGMGGGGAFPDLTLYIDEDGEHDFVEIMIEGPGTMPPFEGQDDQVLADITAYVYSTF